jgi:hypothetical protein
MSGMRSSLESTNDTTANAGALSSWETSPGHNAVVLNEGVWEMSQWKAIGVGIFAHYAVVWFGDQKEPEAALPTAS